MSNKHVEDYEKLWLYDAISAKTIISYKDLSNLK